MATVNIVSLNLALSELKSLTKIFTDATENEKKRNDIIWRVESGELSLPQMINTNKIIKSLTKNSMSKPGSFRKLYGEDLHNYLSSLLVIRCEPTNDFLTIQSENNFEELVEFLNVRGKKILNFSLKRLFSDYCHYGYVLHRVFHLYKEKFIKKEVNMPFAVFVENNLRISDRQALKLRRVGELWYTYKRLGNLGITLEEFYKRLNEIKLLMNTHSNIAAFWRSDEDSSSTPELSFSIKIEKISD